MGQVAVYEEQGSWYEALRDEPLLPESGKARKSDVMLVTRHRNQRV